MSLLAGGCIRPQEPDYARPLPAGVEALRKLEPEEWPALPRTVDSRFHEACRHSLSWFQLPSARQHFPINGVTHGQARASVFALHALLEQAGNRVPVIMPELQRDFDLWQSVGWDGEGTVLYTGYFAPQIAASRQRTDRFQFPLYRRPPNLVTDPVSGDVLGWQGPEGQLIKPPTRGQIESLQLLAGQELVWVGSRLNAYIVHVNGSARLVMADGSTAHIGYAGTNGHPYTSVGQLLVKDGKISRNRLSLPALKAHFRRHPSQLEHYIRQNDRFVFFRLYDGSDWPAGSLGFPVTPMRSLATDKTVFPRGVVTMVDTRVPTVGGATRRIKGLMLDQDTGGAIRAAGRADIYMGVGPTAELLAGRQAAEGRLYYLLLKPGRVAAWLQRMPAVPQGPQTPAGPRAKLGDHARRDHYVGRTGRLGEVHRRPAAGAAPGPGVPGYGGDVPGPDRRQPG